MHRTMLPHRLLGMGIVTCLLAGPSVAGTGTYTPPCASFGPATPDWNQTLSVGKFDPALGTLIGVRVTLEGTYGGNYTIQNLSPNRQDFSVSVNGTVRVFCPVANCNPSAGDPNLLISSNPVFAITQANSPPEACGAQLAPDPDGGGPMPGGFCAGSFDRPLPPLALDLPDANYTLTLGDFISANSPPTAADVISFPVQVNDQSALTANPGSFDPFLLMRAQVRVCVTYLYDVQTGPCELNTRDTPGSLLLFPRFDSRMGKLTVLTVTNTNCSFMPRQGTNLLQGTVDAEFVYVGRYGPNGEDLPCLEVNRTVRLSPCDTFTTIAASHNPNQSRGFLYVFAKDPTSGQAVVFNHLIGQAVYLSSWQTTGYPGDGARDALNARTFLGIGSQNGLPANYPTTQPADWTPTDLAHFGVRDLDGKEYSEAPDEILIPRFLGQDGGMPDVFRSRLVLVNLSGGSNYDATVNFSIYDDSENMTSRFHSFRCWDEQRLIDIDGAFAQSFIASTSTSPNEILGAPDMDPGPGVDRRKAGWFKIDGVEAHSGIDVTIDPVIYAVLFERVGYYEVCDLPWELCTDPRGDLYEFGALFDEDPDNP